MCGRDGVAVRGSVQAPALVVLAVAGVGLAVAATLTWDLGTTIVGLAALLAAGLRLALPVRSAGWLVVRSRGFDATVLLALGFGLLVLTASVPET